MMQSVFSNASDFMMFTWIILVSTMHVFLEILEQMFFQTFLNSCFNYLVRSVFAYFRVFLEYTTPFLQYLRFTFS